jgi:N-acetylmuramic acid 6-phosphate etherase
MSKITESDSHYDALEQMSTDELLISINKEDSTVSTAVKNVIPKISTLVNIIVEKLKNNGRLFYLGAGTSGRLGILDASECPPTFGVSHEVVIGLIAGGDSAIRKAVEFAEDDFDLGWNDLVNYNISNKDVVVGIAASGTTPYVVGALKKCQANNIITSCIVCNSDSQVASFSDYPIEVIVGPEFLTGSTRMKAGTAQKLVLNMITTSTMIKIGKVIGNKMVDMQLSNSKLIERGTKMIMNKTSLSFDAAKQILIENGSVRNALNKING